MRAKRIDAAAPPAGSGRGRWLDAAAVLMPLALVFGRGVQLPALERVFFFGVSPDRLFFGALTAWLLVRRFLLKRPGPAFSKAFLAFLGMMAFWIVYAAALAFFSEYTSLRETGRAGFLLFRGMCVIFCLYEILDTPARTELFFRALRLTGVLMVALALGEVLCGVHLPVSRYGSMPVVFADGRRWLTGLYAEGLFRFTGVCYNQNNYCAMLAILLPLFFLSRDLRPGRRIGRCLVLAAGVFLLALDDANIDAMGFVAGLIVYLLLSRGGWGRKLGMAGGGAVLLLGGSDWLARGLAALKRRVFAGAAAEELLEKAGRTMPKAGALPGSGGAISVAGRVQTGVEAAARSGSGPLMARIRIYRYGLRAFLAGKGLGLGANGYPTFMERLPDRKTRILDPHNWWLEILANYGILVFLAYTVSIVVLYVRLIRLCLRRRSETAAMTAAMCTVFVIACMAPSSLLGEVYQWMLPGLCLVLLRQDGEPPVPEA